ncbi:MAG TPA: hypothetical protein PLR20_12290 [Syntrophales bacterium]|nr:hypothetical protein [Syntrophales bacterium]HOX93717.1 hypothetical protein [Syntrophales bacterium]HPI57062.1 hypothetical protein [Syntrophales bacterium]HPN23808.1 hypothetical protein [Syntrophales bacterium]HQM30121.1 hypothetical protein [Syntrophales bacterium]
MSGQHMGEILVRKNIITDEQLEKALERQKREKGKFLGEILLDMGVPQDQINKVLFYYNKRTPVGQILVDLGVITPAQLREALDKQKSMMSKLLSYKPLGMMLVDLGFVNYRTYLDVLSRHFNMPIVHLKYFKLRKAFQQEIGEEYALRNKIIVLNDDGRKMEVVLSEPSVLIQEELRKFMPAGKEIVFKLADPHDIVKLLQSNYDPYSVTGYA